MLVRRRRGREQHAVDLAAVETPLSSDLHAFDLAVFAHAENRALIDLQMFRQFFEG